ncbi:MAG: YtxH domain-containing protein, partial [Bacillota bacterium]|nr:YtxH domain-containing protein [Bacillota bacterium]
MNQTMTETEKNSKLLKGVVIGGVIGGIISLLDAATRSSVKETALELKSTSQKMLNDVIENPTDVKEQMVQQFNQASTVLKDAMNDAQNLYERLNNDVFSKMGDVKQMSSEALSTVRDVKEEIQQIGSKVVDAGSELKGVTT